MKYVAAFFLYVFAHVSHAETPREVRVNIGGTPFELVKYNNASENQTFFGEYVTPPEWVERFHYHFFPDKKLMVTVSCDLCPQTPIAEGVFKFENGRISIKYTTKKGQSLYGSPLFVLHGYDVPAGGAEKRYEIIILDSANYNLALRGKGEVEFLRRVEPYRDWKDRYLRLKKRSQTHGKFVTPDGFPKLVPPK